MRRMRALALALVLFGFSRPVHAGFILPGVTSGQTKLDAGFYVGTLDITVAGVVDLMPQTGFHWLTHPDGSLVAPLTDGTYSVYANPGSTHYPTVAGGDGINHFPGGGANYDTATNPPNGQFGFVGSRRRTRPTPGPSASGPRSTPSKAPPPVRTGTSSASASDW